jgi:hypothetical protein
MTAVVARRAPWVRPGTLWLHARAAAPLLISGGFWLIAASLQRNKLPVSAFAVLAAAVVLYHLTGALAARALGDETRRTRGYRITTGSVLVAISALAVLNNLGARPVLPAFATGIVVLLGVLAVALVVCRARGTAPVLFASLATAAALIAWFWWFSAQAGDPLNPRRLIWSGADQQRYFELTRDILAGRFRRTLYPPGTALVFAPMLLLIGGGKAQALNLALVPLLSAGCWTAIVYALTRAVESSVSDARRKLARAVTPVALAALVVIYVARSYGGPLDNAYEVLRGSRRLFGLVFAPEPLQLLFVALSLGLVLRASREPGAFNPWFWGAFSGLMLAVAERSFFIVVPLFAVLATCRGNFVRTVFAGLGFSAVLLPLFAYFRLVYGAWLFPNRAQRWETRSERFWRERALERYGWDEVASPPQYSFTYFPSNFPAMFGEYGWALVLALACTLFLLLRRREPSRAWLYACALLVLHFVLVLGYIGHTVSFRYFVIGVPALALLVSAALVELWALLGRRFGAAAR